MNKRGIAPLLLMVLFVALIGGVYLYKGNFGLQRLALFSTLDYAGFTWQDSGAKPSTCTIGTSSSNSVVISGEILTFALQGTNQNSRYIETDVTGIDELLIIYDGQGSATSAWDFSVGVGLTASIIGSEGGSISQVESINAPVVLRAQNVVSRVIPASLWKFKNNFDGTWSTMQSLGVGDIFIVKETLPIKGNQKLRLSVAGGTGCGGYGRINQQQQYDYNAQFRVYNIVRKENSFALCKADQFIQDKNQDGKITSDECVDLKTIILNSEEAIKESTDEKLARIEAELLAKNEGLNTEIQLLNQRLAEQGVTQSQIDLLKVQITALENELKANPNDQLLQSQLDELKSQDLAGKIASLELELSGAKQQLANVQAGDKNVIAVVENQEQFKQPNAFKRFINRVVAWIKNPFGLLG